jgi:hypothetical protein
LKRRQTDKYWVPKEEMKMNKREFQERTVFSSLGKSLEGNT